MKTYHPFRAIKLAIIPIILTCHVILSAQTPKPIVYVCAPCSSDCHDGKLAAFSQPGTCPGCGMRLIDETTVIDVAILIFNGVQIIDYTAPYEIFGQAHFNVFTVAEKAEPITTAMGMRVVPRYTLSAHPEPDVLLTPGGDVDVHLNNPAIIAWIQKQELVADYVLSVCNGAFFLAKTGLLDGKSATTYYGLLEEFENLATKTTVVNNQRFVDNGKIITSAGLSAGMDASLYLVSKIRGMGRAQSIALNLEYNWQPEVEFARSVLADYKYLRDLDVFTGLETELLYTRGTTNNWRQEWRVKGKASAKEVLDYIDKKLEPFSEWQKVAGANGDAAGLASNWQMTGENGEPWTGKVSVEPMSGKQDEFKVRVEIARVNNQTRR